MTRRAFTLVEILTVVVIIGILVTLVTLAVAGAQRSAKRARIAVEMNQIVMALEHYKNEFGEYPPDMFDDEALVRHVKKRWPRFVIEGSDVKAQSTNIKWAITLVYRNTAIYPSPLLTQWAGKSQNGVSLHEPNAVIHALSFWLGGFVQPDGKMQGFGADPEAPFGRHSGNSKPNDGTGQQDDVTLGTVDKKVFLPLELGKNITLVDATIKPVGMFFCLSNRLNSDTFVPFVYFKGRSGGGFDAYRSKRPALQMNAYNFGSKGLFPWGDLGIAVPYAKTGTVDNNGKLINAEWVEAEKYQLIHPGLDGKFGQSTIPGNTTDDKFFRSLESLTQADLDNITNFSGFKEIRTILK
jgi:prepilin-type N-terminal cleavage/methylation domain-containing protein